VLGNITGDIIGSYYEFKKTTPYDFTPLFHPLAKITDDTVCTIAVMDGLINSLDATQALHKWGREYWSVGGWGKKFALWLASPNPTPYGSYGNGCAMRVAPVAWFAKSEVETLELSDKFTRITHNHPDSMSAARATSLAIFLGRTGTTKNCIRERLSEYYDLAFSIDEIKPNYKRTEVAKDSVPQAIVCALEATSFEDAIRKAVSLSGDTDTQAAIAGGIAEAIFGIPDEIRMKTLSYLDDTMLSVVKRFYTMVEGIN
jgi:ADP-ribosylglycohydrolase